MIDKDPLADIPMEERGKIKDAEINYVYVSIFLVITIYFNNVRK